MTYNNGTVKAYFNGQLMAEKSNLIFNPYEYICIGTSYLSENRTMRGAIKQVKIWKEELSAEEISQIDYDVTRTRN